MADKSPFQEFAKKGEITKVFVVCCCVCGGIEADTANTHDLFIEDITSEMGDWRRTRNHGYAHKKCQRAMPQVIKFS